MKRLIMTCVAAAGLFSWPAAWAANDSPAIRVGVYDSGFGAGGIRQALQAASGLQVAAIADWEAETLFKYDVIVLGSVKGPRYQRWQDARYYGRYPVLVSPRYSLNYLAPEEYDALVAYLKNGGALILLDGAVSTSRPDLTGAVDRTAELTGAHGKRAAQSNAMVKVEGPLLWPGTGGSVTVASFPALLLNAIGRLDATARPLVTVKAQGLPALIENTMGQQTHPDVRARNHRCGAGRRGGPTRPGGPVSSA
ncbi:MAG: hypothetical protein PHW60_00265 [Kiritimatiellae bacterium]|nr:hypothetical protein [Kiritimatiellia bacterium]